MLFWWKRSYSYRSWLIAGLPILVGCAAPTSLESDEQHTGQVQQAAVACLPPGQNVDRVCRCLVERSCEFDLPLAYDPAHPPETIAIGGSSKVLLNDRVRIREGTTEVNGFVSNIGIEGVTYVGNDAIVGDILSQEVVELRDRSRSGNVISQNAIRVFNNTVHGTLQPFTPVESNMTYRLDVNWPSVDGGSRNLEPLESWTPPPGVAFGQVTVKRAATMKLATGNYYFNSLDIEPSAHVIMDTSAGPIYIYVLSHFADKAKFEDNGNPNVLVAYFGTEEVFVLNGYRGVLVAPTAKVTLSSLGPHVGAFFAKEIEAHQGGQIQHLALPDVFEAFTPRTIGSVNRNQVALPANQSESVAHVSALSDETQVEVVSYNDATFDDNRVYYDGVTRAVLQGASLMGWAFRVTSPALRPFWGIREVPTPPGIAALWGDPAIAGAPQDPNLVLMANLSIPQSKFDMSSEDVVINGATVPALLGGLGAESLGGGCVARSLDAGITFAQTQCFADYTLDPNGHFYDGLSLAVDGSSNPPVAYAGFVDVTANGPAIWRTPDARDLSAHPFVQISTNFGAISSHPRLHVPNGVLWVLGRQGNNLNVLRGTDTAATTIATNVTQNDVELPSSKIRLGPQYSFDFGASTAGGPIDEMRFAFTYSEGTLHHIAVGRCPIDNLGACELPSEWTTEAPSAGGTDSEQFHPSLRYGDGVWMLSYYSSQFSPGGDGVGIFYARMVVSQSLRAFKATPFQTPCPDVRQAGGTIVGGYWGDYDEMAYNKRHKYFLRPYTDSSLGCVTRIPFNSGHVHVSTVKLNAF